MIPLFKVNMAQEAIELVGKVLQSGYIGQGEKVEEFEQAFGQLVDAPEPPLSVNSCTAALDLALHLIGIKAGDEVITTPMTCTATNGVIVNRGAIPVWADVDPISGLIDPADVARKITKKTKAIMAVDWSGHPCNYDALNAMRLPVIEDAAHALLTQYDNESIARSGGSYVCWSFQAIKHLTTGDGGALLCPNGTTTERARLLRWYGLNRRSSASFRCEQNIQEVGYKYHMNDIAASIGLANIKYSRRIVELHRLNAKWYNDNLKVDGVTLPPWDNGSAWWLYTILVEKRDSSFIPFMKERGIDCSPVHARNDKHDAFHFPVGALPGVDHFASKEVAIPVGWWVRPEDREYIAQSIIEWRKTL